MHNERRHQKSGRIFNWDILCDDCVDKAVKLLEKIKALRLFDIARDDYGFCPNCAGEIDETFQQPMKAEFGDEIP